MRKVDVRTNVPIGTAAEMADQIMRFIDERFPGVRHGHDQNKSNLVAP